MVATLFLLSFWREGKRKKKKMMRKPFQFQTFKSPVASICQAHTHVWYDFRLHNIATTYRQIQNEYKNFNTSLKFLV